MIFIRIFVLMKRNRTCFAVLIALVLTLGAGFMSTGCGAIEKAAIRKISEIRMTSFKLDKLTPVGLTAIDATFYVGVDNPTVTLSLADARATLLYKGEPAGCFEVEPFELKGHSEVIYLLTGHARLSSMASYLTLMNALAGKYDDFTVEISGTGKALGVSKNISHVMKLTDLMNMVSK